MSVTFWIALLVIVTLLLLALLVRVRLSVSAQAHGEPDGSWASAAGVQFGPLAVAVLAARGIPPMLTVHVVGRELMRRRIGATKKPAVSADPKPDVREAQPEAAAEPTAKPSLVWRRFKQRLDFVELAGQVLTERRRFEIGMLDVDLAYSFRDVALTGQVLGGVYALTAILPRRIRINQVPRWEFVDRFQIATNGYLHVRPGLLLVDASWYVLKVLVRGRASEPQGATHSP